MRAAIIEGNIVINVIEYDPAKGYTPRVGLTLVVLADGVLCGPGWIVNGTGYDPPPPYVPTVVEANKLTLTDKIVLALTANVSDVAQDANVTAQAATVITQASALAATTGTRTTAQLSNDVRAIATVIGQIAQGLTILANNDTNGKKELQALIRLIADKLDTTTGT